MLWILVLTITWETISKPLWWITFMWMLAYRCWYEQIEVSSPCWFQLWHGPDLHVVQPAQRALTLFGNPRKVSNSSNLWYNIKHRLQILDLCDMNSLKLERFGRAMVPKITLCDKKQVREKKRDCLTWFLEQQITKAIFPRSSCWILHSDRWIWCECVSMIYWAPQWPISNGGCSCLQVAEWLLSTNSSWRAG